MTPQQALESLRDNPRYFLNPPPAPQITMFPTPGIRLTSFGTSALGRTHEESKVALGRRGQSMD